MTRTYRARRWQQLILLAVIGASACSTTEPSGGDDQVAGDTDPQTTADEAQEYDPSATLVAAGVIAGATHVDPHRSASFNYHTDLWPLYDTLVRSTADMELLPNVAESWEFSDTGLEFTLTLRDDIVFHDGTTLDAKAVVASLERAREHPESTMSGRLAAVDSIIEVDDRTVQLELNRPSASIAGVLSTEAGMIINPAFIDDDEAIAAGQLGVGSGAYTLESLVAGDRLVFEKFADYWDSEVLDRAPARYEYHVVAETQARLNGLRTGDYQVIQAGGMIDALQSELSEDISAGEFELSVISSLFSQSLLMQVGQAPFDLPQVRKSIASGIDFGTLVRTALAGECPSGLGQIWPQGHWAHNPDIGLHEYDPDRARELLADAGLPDGFSTDLALPPGGGLSVSGLPIQGELAKIGVEANLHPIGGGQAYPTFARGEVSMIIHAIFPQPDPALALTTQVLGAGLAGDGPAASELETLAAEADDPRLTRDERAERYRAIGQLINDEQWLIPYCQLSVGHAHAVEIDGMMEQGQIAYASIDPRFIGVRAD